jgi:adenylosuccinate synthase
MSVVVIIGAQWGDEGKGKIVDLLAGKAGAVVRYSGGDNAGHTVINPYGEFKLHLVPSGIFHKKAACIIGNGVAVNPAILLDEIDNLQKHKVDTSRLSISNRAHLIMPYHTLFDGLEEERRGEGAIGTTRKGIGPVFSDKIARLGIRTGDLLNKNNFRSRLAQVLETKNAILTKIYNASPLSLEEIYQQYVTYAERLAPFIRDTGPILRDIISTKRPIILEGAQGTMLDPDFGTYPYVTSSSPIASGGCTGSGLNIKQIDNIIGVFKAYTTRVGGGPMPTELKDKVGEFIRERAKEYGATTGRPRRCGWFDAVAGRYSTQINGFTGIALTRLDVLDALDSIKICTGYEFNGNVIKDFPSDIDVLAKCKPVYEELEGWQIPINNIRQYRRLPSQARRYIRKLEELLSCPVNIISVGANREQSIMVKQII